MLSKRIIPCLDIDSGKVVKGINFAGMEDLGEPVGLAQRYNDQGADEIVFLDISATIQGRMTTLELLNKVSKNVFIPISAGGGVKTLEDIQKLLAAGADKACINTAAVMNKSLIKKAAERFGSQCVIVAIDAKKEGKRWRTYTKSGTTRTGLDAVKWAGEAERNGAGELLVTSIDRDGTKSGYDLELTMAISEAVNIPVIASGGAGSIHDIAKVLTTGKADAALAASIFHNGKYTIAEAKEYLRSRRIKVRL